MDSMRDLRKQQLNQDSRNAMSKQTNLQETDSEIK